MFSILQQWLLPYVPSFVGGESICWAHLDLTHVCCSWILWTGLLHLNPSRCISCLFSLSLSLLLPLPMFTSYLSLGLFFLFPSMTSFMLLIFFFLYASSSQAHRYVDTVQPVLLGRTNKKNLDTNGAPALLTCSTQTRKAYFKRIPRILCTLKKIPGHILQWIFSSAVVLFKLKGCCHGQKLFPALVLSE